MKLRDIAACFSAEVEGDDAIGDPARGEDRGGGRGRHHLPRQSEVRALPGDDARVRRHRRAGPDGRPGARGPRGPPSSAWTIRTRRFCSVLLPRSILPSLRFPRASIRRRSSIRRRTLGSDVRIGAHVVIGDAVPGRRRSHDLATTSCSASDVDDRRRASLLYPERHRPGRVPDRRARHPPARRGHRERRVRLCPAARRVVREDPAARASS